jgi:uncharacterized membrane protein YedE/YeeE
MNLDPLSLHFFATALLVGVMGFATQRGATCTVAAIDEWVNHRRAQRLASMVEASLLVAGGLVIANALHLSSVRPAGYAVSIWVIVGGVFLGIGAYVNQACAFGAIARLGSGEWSYMATPVGFFLGCLLYTLSFPAGVAPAPLAQGSPVFELSPVVVIAVLILLLFRLLWPMFSAGEKSAGGIAHRVWSPQVATATIGITFLFVLLMAGAWAYTDVLAELARGAQTNLLTRVLLLIALYAGALFGGWTAGCFRSTRITVGQTGKCLSGGALMGLGSMMIPGSNDGLILFGMPLLWPYAWVAFVTMCVVIGLAIGLRKRLRKHGA